MGGLGKGLGALLSDNGVQSVDNQTIHKTLREKNRELDAVKDEIEVKKKMIDEIKKDLTIQLLLKGKVDKTQLFEMQEEVKFCFDEKERLEIEIERLSRDASIAMTAPAISQQEENKNDDKPDRKKRSEIDLTMIKDILFEDPPGRKEVDPDDIQEAIELLDEVDDPGKGSTERIDEEEEHLRNLKSELNGPLEAQKVEMESYGKVENEPFNDQHGLTEDTPSISVPDLPEDIENREREVPSEIQKKKVKLVRRVVKDTRKPRDKRFFTLLNEAQYHLMRNDSSSAKKVLLNALREYPMDGDLLYHLGNAFFMEGDLDSAEVRYRKAARVDTNSFRAYNNLGIVLKKKGEREAAIQAFNQALEIKDDYDRGWFNLGTIFMEMNPPMLTEARIFLRRSLECNPDLEEAKEKLAEVTKMAEESS